MAKKENIQTLDDITLDDIYKAFGKQKKHYATRLKHAFLEHHVETIDDLMALSLNDLLNMDGIWQRDPEADGKEAQRLRYRLLSCGTLQIVQSIK